MLNLEQLTIDMSEAGEEYLAKIGDGWPIYVFARK